MSHDNPDVDSEHEKEKIPDETLNIWIFFSQIMIMRHRGGDYKRVGLILTFQSD